MNRSGHLIKNQAIERVVRCQHELPDTVDVSVRFVTMRKVEDQLMYLFEVQWQMEGDLHITEVWMNHGWLLKVPMADITLTH